MHFYFSNCTLKPCKNAPNRDKKNSLAFANETKCLSFCLKHFFFRFAQEVLQKRFIGNSNPLPFFDAIRCNYLVVVFGFFFNFSGGGFSVKNVLYLSA